MSLWIGSFAKSGSPSLKVKISGPFSDGVEYDAIIDTGFTGFASIPLAEAIRLGLLLWGTTSVSFANGETSYRLTGKCQIAVDDQKKIGVAILEWQASEVLLGMAFVRQFEKVLLVTSSTVVLQDEAEPPSSPEPSPDNPPSA